MDKTIEQERPESELNILNVAAKTLVPSFPDLLPLLEGKPLDNKTLTQAIETLQSPSQDVKVLVQMIRVEVANALALREQGRLENLLVPIESVVLPNEIYLPTAETLLAQLRETQKQVIYNIGVKVLGGDVDSIYEDNDPLRGRSGEVHTLFHNNDPLSIRYGVKNGQYFIGAIFHGFEDEAVQFVFGYIPEGEGFSCPKDHSVIIPAREQLSDREVLIRVPRNGQGIEITSSQNLQKEGITQAGNGWCLIGGSATKEPLTFYCTNGAYFKGSDFDISQVGGKTCVKYEDNRGNERRTCVAFPDISYEGLSIPTDQIIGFMQDSTIRLEDQRGKGGVFLTSHTKMPPMTWNKVKHSGIFGRWKAWRGDYHSVTCSINLNDLAASLPPIPRKAGE